jgi:transposase
MDNAHVRRALFDLYEATQSPTAKEALDRIGKLYEIETAIRGQSVELRLAARQQYSVALLDELHRWMIDTRTKVENKSALAKALDYALNRWQQLSHFTQDGTLEADNNIAERSVRGVGIGRKNFMFFGSDTGGERAAIAYSIIESCKLNQIDPQRYLEYVLARIADHPINRIEQLLPWNVADKLDQPDQVSQAMAA